MFPRVATVKRGSKTCKYLQIVEAYRVDGRTTQRVVAMRSVGLAELNLNGQTTRLVSGGSRDARRVARALGIANLNPPVPAKRPSKAQEGPM